MLFVLFVLFITITLFIILTIYENREFICIFLKECCFSKIWWINCWHQFLINNKYKTKLAFPFEMKKFIAKNASIKLKIKLFQSSKQFQQIIKKLRGKQCGEFCLRDDDDDIWFFLDDTNIALGMHWTNQFLSKDNPLFVKEKFSTLIYPEDIVTNKILEELYPKLDLTELKEIELPSIALNINIFMKYLVPSLVKIQLTNVFVENVDIPLMVLEQCPMATRIE